MYYQDDGSPLSPNEVRQWLLPEFFNEGIRHSFYNIDPIVILDQQSAMSYEMGRQLAAVMKAERIRYQGPAIVNGLFVQPYGGFFVREFKYVT